MSDTILYQLVLMPSHPGHIEMYQAIYQHTFCLSQLFTSKIPAPTKLA